VVTAAAIEDVWVVATAVADCVGCSSTARRAVERLPGKEVLFLPQDLGVLGHKPAVLDGGLEELGVDMEAGGDVGVADCWRVGGEEGAHVAAGLHQWQEGGGWEVRSDLHQDLGGDGGESWLCGCLCWDSCERI